MTLRKKVLLVLSILPIILLLIALIRPVHEGDQYNGLELIFLVLGLPILVLDYFEWSNPQLIDRIFGTSSAGPGQNLVTEQPKTALSGLNLRGLSAGKTLAALGAVLVLGFGLGAGALFIFTRQNNLQTTPTSVQAIPHPAATQATPTRVRLTATPTATLASSPNPATEAPSGPSPTPEDVLPSASPEPTQQVTADITPNLSRCISPTEAQFNAIQTGVQLLDPNYKIEKAYAVKSIAADGLWFFAAKIFSPDLDNGVTIEPGIWSFYQDNNPPYDIYAINDIAFQYSDFTLGQQANPPIDMQVNGAEIAYQCATIGK